MKAKRPFKVNKFIFLVIFLAIGVLSMGASSWLIINEQSGSPEFNNALTTTIESTNDFFAQNGQFVADIDPQKAPFKAVVKDSGGKEVCSTTNLSCFSWTYGTLNNGEITENNSKLTSKTNGTTTLVVTFTPNDSLDDNKDKYESKQIAFPLSMRAVAYIDSESNSYGTIEGALNAAVNGNKVYVIPENTTYNPYVIKACEVKSGVNFILPYTSTDWGEKRDGSAAVFADSVSDNLKTVVSVNNTITNNGTINIGGIVGHAGAGISGQTSGFYSQITMLSNGKIESNGNINCLGFIKDGAGTESKGIILNKGKLQMPFVVYDFRGGTNTAGLYVTGYNSDKITPFNRYDLPNVQCYLKVTSKATVGCYADLYAQSKHNTTEFNMYASSNAVFNLKDGACLETTYKAKKADGSASPNTTEYGITQLKITGGASLGALSMVVQGITVKMSECRFPIPFNFNINLSSGEYTFGYRVKLMSGAILTVEEDASLTITDELIVYPKSTRTASEESENVFYDDNPISTHYPARETAELCVYGTVTATSSLTGLINSYSKKAKLTLASSNSITSYEATASGGVMGAFATVTPYDTITNYANGTLYQSGNGQLSAGTYYSIESSTDVYEWFGEDQEFNISYVHKMDDEVTDLTAEQLASITNNNATKYTLTTNSDIINPTSTIDGFVCAGLYVKNSSNELVRITGIVGETMFSYYGGNAEIYVLWTQAQTFTISYISEQYSTEFTKTVEGVIEGSTFTLASDISSNITKHDHDITKEYYFDKWLYTYTAEDGTNVTNSETAPTKVLSDITVTAKWKQKKSITVTLNNTTLALNGQNRAAGKYWGKPNDNITFSATPSNNYKDPKVTITNYKSETGNGTASGSFVVGDNDITITTTATRDTGCFAAGTLITLADGTKKAVEDLTLTDEVLVFNHVTGKVEKGTISFIDHADQAARLTEVINLKFSNNTLLRLSYSHGLFDVDLNKYVFITADNYLGFIGHNFYSINYVNGEVVEEIITLENAYLTEEVVRVYTPFTAEHSNIFADGLLTYPPDTMNINALANIFDFDEDMKIDQEKMQSDIEKYGLYTYEELQNYVTYEQYEYLSLAYLKIAVGKGYITWDEVLIMLEYITNSVN